MLPLGLFVLFVAVGFFDDDSTVDLEADGTDGDPAQDGDGGVVDDVPLDADDDPADGSDETVDDILAELELTLETDPVTGKISVTGTDDETGSLALIEGSYDDINASPNFGWNYTYDRALFYVPDGLDVQAAYDTFDWEAFEQAFVAENGVTPTFVDYFEALGLEVVVEFDQTQWNTDSQGTVIPPPYIEDPDSEFDTRSLLPEITSNLDIAFFKVDSAVNSRHYFDGGFDLVEVEDQQAFDHKFYVSVDSDEPFAEDSETEIFVADGDVINGTAFNDDIDSPPGDPTAITIFGGGGTDHITAGLNDTIITNDDTEEDLIQVGEPASYAQIYDEVPVLQAGPEDIVEVDGDGNFVVRFEQDAGNGVTDVFYHVLTSDAALVPPASSVESGEALSLKDFYARSGWQLLAVGGLGNITTDGATTSDNTIPPPSFSGLDTAFFNQSNGLFSMKLGVDGAVTNQTVLTSGWPALA